MTISQAMQLADRQLHHLPDHQTIARSLITHVAKLSKEQQWAYPNNQITPQQQSKLEQLFARASQHEPLAYLLGYKEFYGRPFTVTPDTLIPRPESEQLITLSLNYYHKHLTHVEQPIIVDVGTGSGCLAITLALEIPTASVIAIDTSKAALAVAKRNASSYKLRNLSFSQGSLLGPLSYHLPPNSAHIIVANLPYISDKEFQQLPANVKNFEPKQALLSGPHPDDLNLQLITQAPAYLADQSFFAYETTNGHIQVVKDL